jgi:4-amino-4-deoxy-L-arabinose transferase-like glycosyltransferase
LNPGEFARTIAAVKRWGMIAMAALVLFFQLGTRGLNEPDEGRYAEVGRAMAASGDWLVPRFNGIEHLSKPPVTYWLIAASIKLFGVNEWAARLPAALAALGTVVALGLMVRRAADERAGMLAMVVLLASAQFFVVARLITTDMLVSCFAAWSVWALWNWHTSDRSCGKILWFYVFLGLGFLTKGPPAVIPPLFAVAALCWKNPDLKLRQLCWGRGLLVFLAIGLPWYVALAVRQPQLWDYFLVREVLERVATSVHKRTRPFWYFIPVMAVGFLPWTLALPWAGKWRVGSGRSRDFLRMCAGWWGLSFLMFSVVKSKLPTYVTPLYVPLAAMAALQLARYRRWPAVVAGVTLAIFVGAVAAFPVVERRLSHQVSAREFAERIRREDPPGTAPVVQCHTFLCGLPFYLQRPVLWYHPPRADKQQEDTVYEFSTAHRGPHILNQPEQLRELLGGPARVFCIAATRRVRRLQEELGQPLVELQRAGDWSLLSNQP